MERKNMNMHVSFSQGGGESWIGTRCAERAAGGGRDPHLSGTSPPGLATVSLHSH